MPKKMDNPLRMPHNKFLVRQMVPRKMQTEVLKGIQVRTVAPVAVVASVKVAARIAVRRVQRRRIIAMLVLRVFQV